MFSQVIEQLNRILVSKIHVAFIIMFYIAPKSTRNILFVKLQPNNTSAIALEQLYSVARWIMLTEWCLHVGKGRILTAMVRRLTPPKQLTYQKFIYGISGLNQYGVPTRPQVSATVAHRSTHTSTFKG